MRDQAYWNGGSGSARRRSRRRACRSRTGTARRASKRASAAPSGRTEGAEPRWREGKTGEEAAPEGGRDGSKARARRTAPRGTAGSGGGPNRRGAPALHARGSADRYSGRPGDAHRADPGALPLRGVAEGPGAGSARSAAGRRDRRMGGSSGSWNGYPYVCRAVRATGNRFFVRFRDRESDLLLEVDLPADFSAEPGDLVLAEVAEYPEGGKEGRARLVRALGSRTRWRPFSLP